MLDELHKSEGVTHFEVTSQSVCFLLSQADYRLSSALSGSWRATFLAHVQHVITIVPPESRISVGTFWRTKRTPRTSGDMKEFPLGL